MCLHNIKKLSVADFKLECLLTSSCAICSPPNQIFRANIPSHRVTNSIPNIWMLHIDHSQDVFKSKCLCLKRHPRSFTNNPSACQRITLACDKKETSASANSYICLYPPLSICIMWQRWWALWHPHWSQITTKKKKKAVSSLFVWSQSNEPGTSCQHMFFWIIDVMCRWLHHQSSITGHEWNGSEIQ